MTTRSGGNGTAADFSDLIARLRASARGFEEWRVQNPEDGSYCMCFSRNDCLDPQYEAEQWLDNHRKNHPGHAHSRYEVARVRVLREHDLLLLEAADALHRSAWVAAGWKWTPRAGVTGRHPSAYCVQAAGAGSLWFIYREPLQAVPRGQAHQAVVLGQGATASRAWTDAWKRRNDS